MRKPIFELNCNGGSCNDKSFKLKNVSSIIISNIQFESFVLISHDGGQTNLLLKDPRLPTSLSPGEEREFMCDHRDLRTRPIGARELCLVFTAEDEDSVKYQVRSTKNVEDTRECNAYGLWETIIEAIDGHEEDQEVQMEKEMKIFISHRGPEVEMAEAFVDFFEDLGVHSEAIVCTSVPEHLIPNGEDIYDWLRQQFTDYNLHVIFLLSTAYYKSAACLNEMGAAWVMGSKADIILTPGFKTDKMEGVLGKDKMAIDWNANEGILYDRLAQLRDSVCSEFGLEKPGDRRWVNKRNDLVERIRRFSPSESETEGD